MKKGENIVVIKITIYTHSAYSFGGRMVEINKDLIGKRVLYKLHLFDILREGVIKEISPSGDYIKINDGWYESDVIRIVEVLGKE